MATLRSRIVFMRQRGLIEVDIEIAAIAQACERIGQR